MCPMVPYTIFNYLLGLTDVRLRDFVPAGAGMLPGILVRLFVGSTLSAITQESLSFESIMQGEHSKMIIGLIIGGGLVGAGGIAYTTRLTKRYLSQLESNITEKDIENTYRRVLS
jgi:uncharacterized membrane protein YdjX (TVP38/TMEM64 family)